MECALLLATAVVPLYTGLLHGWIYLQRRREALHLWLAVAAVSAAAIATAVIGRGHAGSFAEARVWQRVQMGAGCALAIGFVRWTLAFLELQRPRVEAAVWALCGAVLAGLVSDVVFARDGAVRQVVLGGPAVPEPGLTAFGQAVLAIFVFFVGYVGVELALACRKRPDARAVFLAYVVFAASLLHDAARGSRWLSGPELLPFGYLAMITGISAVLIRGFVRSMQQSERLATHLHEFVEERSAELRRKEVLLIHGERLATLGTLAAGVAHELNDPMAFVSSSLNRVEESWRDPRDRADVPEILGECRDGLARLRGTVAELLRLARGGDAELGAVDLSQVVRSVLPVVRAEARYRARLVEELEPVPGVTGNPGLLAHVALHLLLNGVRAAPDTAGDHEVRVSTRCEGGRVRLRVRDEGPAIPRALLAGLFDPFSSLAAGAESASHLGFAVTHQIVSSHGGEIAVASDDGGTEVTVWLPVAEARGA
ncbi:MAG TPA: ATP-binding protein [Myxococcota bacterium]|nr:ATP-binding protein [Myxococcota bacterium]